MTFGSDHAAIERLGDGLLRGIKEAAGEAVYKTGYKDGVRDTWFGAAILLALALVVVVLLRGGGRE